MDIRTLMLVVGLALAGPVLASDCPNLMAEVDKILAEKTDLEQDLKDQVAALRTESEQLHQDGKHEEAAEKLDDALSLLGVE